MILIWSCFTQCWSREDGRREERRGEGPSGPAACWLAGITVLWHRTITQNAHYETIPVGAVECQREFPATEGIFTSSWVNTRMYCSAKQLDRNVPLKKDQELKHDSSEESQQYCINLCLTSCVTAELCYYLLTPAGWLSGSPQEPLPRENWGNNPLKILISLFTLYFMYIK